MTNSGHKPSVFGGTMIIAGTAIGAGMLGLPTISAGMWFYWSVFLLFGTWALMLLSSQALLEVNLHYEPGSSFDTLVKGTLGQGWNIFNGVSVAFVLYILVYAYVSGGGSIVKHSVTAFAGVDFNAVDAALGFAKSPDPAVKHFSPTTFGAGLFFAVLLTICVWWSTWIVDRISVIMMAGMVITFFLSMSGLLGQIKTAVLLDVGGTGGEAAFVLVTLSTYLTSFCFHASVPSMVKYFGKDPVKINKCLIYGTLIALACYLVWILGTDGNISRGQFKQVIADGGNVGHLVKAAGTNSSDFIQRMLEAFAALAVATSFLGAGLGLFDYMADLLKFDDSRLGRTKTTLITFVPPTVGGLIWPDGFLLAIGWAGLAAALWSVIIPAMMLRASRRQFGVSLFRVPGGSIVIPVLLLYGIGTAICHTLVVFDLLPMYK